MAIFDRKYFSMSILSGAAYAINSDYAKELGVNLNSILVNSNDDPDAGKCGTGVLDFGFAAYVYQDSSNTTIKTIAFRGTDLDRVPPDPLDIAANTDIATNGVAMQQIVDMYNYVSSLRTGVQSQYRLVASALPPLDNTPCVQALGSLIPGVPPSLVYYSLELSGTVVGSGVIQPGDTVNLTGHSLGGELALAASKLFGTSLPEIDAHVLCQQLMLNFANEYLAAA